MARLDEFVTAQNACWAQVETELREGRKTTHWIWWVFPQLKVLARSPRARYFGLADLAEAQVYYDDDLLGTRLDTAAHLLLDHAGTDPVEILGPVDALKVRSCMTLFEAVRGADPVFGDILTDMYDGTRCPITQAALTGG